MSRLTLISSCVIVISLILALLSYSNPLKSHKHTDKVCHCPMTLNSSKLDYWRNTRPFMNNNNMNNNSNNNNMVGRINYWRGTRPFMYDKQ